MLSLAGSALRTAAAQALCRRPTVLSVQVQPASTPLTSFIESTLPAMFHTSVALERARQVTRAKKRKLTLANIKKKAERLKKNPKPIAKKVELMLKSKGLWGPPKPIR